MPPAPKRLDRKQLDRDLAALRQRLQRMSALAETGREDRIPAAKADFRLFCQTYLPHYLDRPSSSFHHWIFAQAPCWGQGAKLCIAAPRGYAKTTYLVRAYCLWRLARGDAAFPVLLQDSSELAEQSLAVIKVELEDNPRLAADFPELVGEGRLWRQDKIITASGVPVAALGSGKRIRGLNINGLRPSLVLADDLENDENVLSKTQRDKVESWFVKAVLELGLADGSLQVILVGTMLHADCLVARMQRRPDFESHTFSAVARMPERLDLWDEWGRLLAVDAPAAAAFYKARQGEMDAGAEVLWPEMEPLERLMAKRALDPHTFQTEKQNQPLDPDSQVFRTLHFYVEMPNAWRLIVGAVDPAQGLIKGDFTGIVILGQRDDRKALVLEADVTRRNPMATVDRVIELQRKWGCAQWAVEDVAFQAVLRDIILEKSLEAGVPVPVLAVKPLFAKEVRILSLQAPVAAGQILFNPLHGTLNQQLQEFPQAAHDDGPDALELAWSLLRHAGQIAFKSSGGGGGGGIFGRLFGGRQRGF
ncbi:phage terminase large subunit [Megalodesulfovibrio gigas]|uniref:Terminase large subunit gp17-like C-terminal domain-containing protein n=1 Tax=Megalodesulfovibrio gigas (strain ATCC 19364 / DSM 1382 / NCIMB 9332 / VKM B-1759) TaxID=1121448 RepID=T2GCX0_MEGG1|nr:phage terminase large subunit [Megalodesulfovibrio gigas]AGW14133.1 hypothetical protein DGI_2381 [Megalodesulfovibrio gigas DSM 1382 = ATCC 19364]